MKLTWLISSVNVSSFSKCIGIGIALSRFPLLFFYVGYEISTPSNVTVVWSMAETIFNMDIDLNSYSPRNQKCFDEIMYWFGERNASITCCKVNRVEFQFALSPNSNRSLKLRFVAMFSYAFLGLVQSHSVDCSGVTSQVCKCSIVRTRNPAHCVQHQ